MIITISGQPGSGKSSIGKLLAKKLGYKYFGTGQLIRAIAKKQGISFQEWHKKALTDPSNNIEADNKTKELSKQDNIVVDGWIAFHFISDSVKVWLEADETVRAKRIFNAHRKEESLANVEEVKKEMSMRENTATKHYKKLYGIEDITAKKNFDIHFDTTSFSVEENANKLFELIKRLKN